MYCASQLIWLGVSATMTHFAPHSDAVMLQQSPPTLSQLTVFFALSHGEAAAEVSLLFLLVGFSLLFCVVVGMFVCSVQESDWLGRGDCVKLGDPEWLCVSGRTSPEAALRRARRWPKTVSKTILCMTLTRQGLMQLALEQSIEFIDDPWDPQHQKIHFPSFS